ncbi:MAG TPA: hypothetical protein DEQ03_12205 [Marinilabiliales bacterium]|nr:hypothetical protein [Marinilabiliales bacterium]
MVFEEIQAISNKETSQEISSIKGKLVDLLYWIVLIFMWFALVGSLLRIIEIGYRWVNTIQIVMVALFLTSFIIRKRLSYFVKASLLLGIILIIGISGLLSFGLYSQGSFFLLLYVILSSIIISFRWGIINFLISLSVFTLTGFLILNDFLVINDTVVSYSNSFASWVMAIIVFSTITIIIIIFWQYILQYLNQKIEASISHETNLNRINKLLSKEIDTRKQAELMLKNQYEDSRKLNQEYQSINKELQEANAKLEKSNILLHEAKEKSQAADQLKSSFLSNISHEIRTPMNAIVGFTTLINSDDLPTDDTRRYLNIIQSSTNNLLTIISDIVTMAKIESGQFSIHPELIDVNQFLEEITERYTREIFILKENLIEFRVEKRTPEPCFIISDKESLKHITTKLIDNAIKFTEKGAIILSFELLDSGSLAISVKDTGIGIPLKIKNEIFESFRQVDDKNTRRFGGTGLGLSITKGLVDLLNGTIQFISVPGNETVFSVSIPVIIKEGNGAPVPAKTLLLKGKSILIVGKYSWDHKELNQILQETNAMLTYVENGFQALEMCKHEPVIDLAIISMILPDVNALDLMNQMKISLPNIIILAHLPSEKKELVHEKERTWDGFIPNPIKKEELFKTLSKINRANNL